MQNRRLPDLFRLQRRQGVFVQCLFGMHPGQRMFERSIVHPRSLQGGILPNHCGLQRWSRVQEQPLRDLRQQPGMWHGLRLRWRSVQSWKLSLCERLQSRRDLQSEHLLSLYARRGVQRRSDLRQRSVQGGFLQAKLRVQRWPSVQKQPVCSLLQQHRVWLWQCVRRRHLS